MGQGLWVGGRCSGLRSKMAAELGSGRWGVECRAQISGQGPAGGPAEGVSC